MSSQPIIQTSFNSGEWSPALNARVDIAKYHSGAALLKNWFVDYRGGATTHPGTRYIATSVNNGAFPPRLIPFQASFAVSYILEFGVTSGTGYLQFYNNGAPVLSGGVPYSIASPYASSELSQLKFAQNVNQLIICHPNHPPYVLTLISATNWTLAAISFGATIAAPTGLSTSTGISGGTVNLAYIVTSVDVNGQESGPSAYAPLANILDPRTTAGTVTVAWSAVTGAASYNVYRAEPRYGAAVPAGSSFGFVGNLTGTTFIDSNIVPDFSQGPPVPQNPFNGTGITTAVITAQGSYGTGGSGVSAPLITFSGGGGSGAAALATLQPINVAVNSAGNFYAVNDTISILSSFGVVLQVTGVIGGQITSVTIVSRGGGVSGANITPGNPVVQSGTSGGGSAASFLLTWGVTSVGITNPGTGYTTAPAVAFSTGAAAATVSLGAPSSGNPTVPGFFQQRMVLAGPVGSPQQFNMSTTGTYFNFNINSPLEADNAIQGTLVSGQLNTIQSMISQPYGLIFLSDRQAWLINGGGNGTAVSPSSLVANAQAYNGASYPPPIVANDNILYVQAKGSIVRDLVFNYYTQVYTGADISVLSSHLFYTYNILEWAWAEEPFKLVWAVRNDGTMLTLTFLKEQELIAWTHRDTNGAFKSVASVTETTQAGAVDAVYTVVQRTINNAAVQYIERFTEIYYPNGLANAWQVDAGINYTGAGALTFAGATQLAGTTVTGVATDNLGNTTAITSFVMPVNGTFTLPAPVGATNYTNVTVGLPFLPQLQTLELDTGEPTIQGKRKKITGVTLKIKDTLGLTIGQTFDASSQTVMQDLVIGNLNVPDNVLVTGLYTGMARTIIDPDWNTDGQYCIQQPNPFPASILGVIPEITIGDTAK